MMTEIQKADLAKKYQEHLRNADKCRLQDRMQMAASFEESAAKIEAKFQQDDSQLEDYLQ